MMIKPAHVLEPIQNLKSRFLFLTQEEVAGQLPVGYMHIGSKYKLEVGNTNTEEYKFVQCLFSPANYPTARYESVMQTRERVAGAMNDSSVKSSSIESSIRTLGKKEIGKFLKFHFKENMIQMTVSF